MKSLKSAFSESKQNKDLINSINGSIAKNKDKPLSYPEVIILNFFIKKKIG